MGDRVEGSSGEVSEGSERDAPVERWVQLKFARNYEVSDLGNVRRIGESEPLRGHHDKWNYHRVSIRGVTHQVGRLVLEGFVGRCPTGRECAHWDGDPSNNRLTNVRWATSKENTSDQFRHGTMQHGSRNGRSKLNEELVVELRRRYRKGGVSTSRLAEEYGTSVAVANHAINGRKWKSVSEPPVSGEVNAALNRPRGESHHLAKLTAGDVAEMRGLFASGDHTKRALAIRFGIHYNTCRMALDGRTWKHV